ncbi:MAG TPA: class I SAM-dependent methyltransferase [Streptosporangiaceae bacterium]|nr:class I SAM-dependent methyltransferase [Streptosporangiaceae bacterium]
MASRQERARSFGAVAADYDRFRPGPPEAAVDWLLPERCEVAVDVGAGTGLLARALARKVAMVIAVEPDERMRAVLHARSPGVRVAAGTGEAIPLPDASADGVFVSEAWHWMDPDRAAPEIGRVLRDGGRFGVIWTGRDREVGWLRELARLTDPGTAGLDDQAEALRWARRREVRLPEPGVFHRAERASFTFIRTMTKGAIVDMLATYSGIITANPQDRAAGLAQARTALDKRFPDAGEIDVPIRALCWRADRVTGNVPGHG